MNRKAMTMVFAAGIAAGVLRAADHVPTDPKELMPIAAKSAERNHVLIVNVGGAVDDAAWGPAVSFAARRFQINIWTNAVPSVSVPELAVDPKYCAKRFGDKAKLCVFVVNDRATLPFLSAPLCWSVINVRNLKNDNPDAQTYRDRVAKMVIKGLAMAACGGVSVESRCSMYYGSFTLPGLDKAGITLAPMTYFPILEIIQRLGGAEIVNQGGAEE